METNTKARAAALARALTIIVSACGGAAAYTTTSIPEGATSEADATLAAIRAAAEDPADGRIASDSEILWNSDRPLV